jgi:hypothetical protein
MHGSAAAALLELHPGSSQVTLQLTDLTLGLLELAVHGLLELQVSGPLRGHLASMRDAQNDALNHERRAKRDGENPQERAHRCSP